MNYRKSFYVFQLEKFKLTGNKRVDSQPKTSVTARWILEQDGGLVTYIYDGGE
jgi:hypothetical protein